MSRKIGEKYFFLPVDFRIIGIFRHKNEVACRQAQVFHQTPLEGGYLQFHCPHSVISVISVLAIFEFQTSLPFFKPIWHCCMAMVFFTLRNISDMGVYITKGGLNTSMGVLNPFYLESTSISRCLPNVSILISQEFLKEKIKTNHAIIWQKLPQVETTFAHLVCPLFLMSKNCKLIAAAKPPSAKLKGACLLAPIKFDPFISTK